ncbi:MAG: hypothetical protein ACRCSN_18625 [Dermatophilaceae bacterium]
MRAVASCLLARPADGRTAVSVRLASPPPLGRALAVADDDHGDSRSSSSPSSVRLLDGATVMATATPSTIADDELPGPVSTAEACAAESR